MTQNKVALYKAVREDANTRVANQISRDKFNLDKDLGYKRFGTDVAKNAIEGAKAAAPVLGAIASGIAANDPEYYRRVPGVVDPLCKAQFFNVIGTVQDLGYNPENSGSGVFATSPAFGIIHFVPSIGSTFRGNLVTGETQPLPITDSAFTTNAKKIIAGLVSKSGVFSSGIDPQDVLAALCCEVDLWSFIHTWRKLLAAVDMYSIENKTLPKYLCGAILGMNRPLTDAEMLELQLHKLNMISALNALIEGANTMRLPKQLTLLHRRLYLADVLCYDDDKRFNQIYCYKQDAYLKWTDTITIHGHYTQMTDQKWMNDNISGSLVNLGSTPISEYLANFGNDLLNALINSSDITTINGAFLRYYRNADDYYHEDTYKVDVKYEILAMFDYLAASQIRNTKFTGPILMSNTWGIRLQEFDNAAGTYCQILETDISYNATYYLKDGNTTRFNVLLNSKGDEVNEDEVVEMTRNCSWTHRVPVYASSSSSTVNYLRLACGGTEVFTSMSVVANVGLITAAIGSDPASFEDIDSYVILRWTGGRINAVVGQTGSIDQDLQTAYVDYVFRHLKNCPFGFVAVPNSDTQSGSVTLWIGDALENTCAMPLPALSKIHYACVYSEIYLDVKYD